MDTLTAFSEPVEDLGRVECLDGRLKAVVLEMLSDELDVAVERLGEAVALEDELFARGELKVEDAKDAPAWANVVANIAFLGERVLEKPSCGAEPPADMMKQWRKTFSREGL